MIPRRLRPLIERQQRIRKELENKGESVLNENCVAKGSKIHGYGVFALKDIKKGEKIIEYQGEKVLKEESEKRGELEHQGMNGEVYIFTLNRKYDIDGSVGGSGAEYMNHSCDPNCEAVNEDNHIWIVAIKDIKKEEELSYDYGYDTDDYKNHPCKCGSKNCIGYILSRDKWEEEGFE